MIELSLIEPIAPEKIEAELGTLTPLRPTNRSNNLIYSFRGYEAPCAMLELGRLREEAFRVFKAGTGQPLDIDYHDYDPSGYRQLIVWDPAAKKILGGYRYILGKEAIVHGTETNLASEEILFYSDTFITEYLPYCIELGRAFVRPDHQQANGLSPKSLFTLDNLWDGLGALILLNPGCRYFTGIVSIFRESNQKSRDLILYFLNTHFKGEPGLITPRDPRGYTTDISRLKSIIKGENKKEDSKALHLAVKALGESVPPLINAYMNLSDAMQVYGITRGMGPVTYEDIAIMIPIGEIAEEKKKRHMDTFSTWLEHNKGTKLF